MDGDRAIDPDETLAALRKAAGKWDMSAPGSAAQQGAAAGVVALAQSLDHWLSAAGSMPAAWAEARDADETAGIPAIMRAEQIVNSVIGENPAEALYGLTLGRKIVAALARAGLTTFPAVPRYLDEPAELVRPPRTVVVDVTRGGSRWVATSEQIDGFRVSSGSREALHAAAREALAGWLDPAVTLEFAEKF
jgi:hypothetical protein